MLLAILGWVIVGVIIGFVASRLVNLRGDDSRLGIGLSAVSATIGGLLYSWISGSPMVLLNVWSLVYAGIAATVAVTVWHLVRSRSPYAQPSIRRSY